MVALPSQLPLLRIGTHELGTYEAGWLAGCIRQAALVAGHADWWFADDIALAMVRYLQNRYQSAAITLDELENKIVCTLRKIGFSDVASQLRMDPPQIRLSLNDLVRQSEGMELAFFHLLDDHLSSLRTAGVRKVSLTGTKAAIKHLRCAKHWTAECQCLEDRIVDIVRHRLAEDSDDRYELKLERY